MSRQRIIKNTNIRLNLAEEEDRRAWEYLQTLDRKKYKSYSRACVAAINDYFSRQEQLEEDPYLETREKEDEFLKKVTLAVEEGAKEAFPIAVAGNLLQLLQPALTQGNSFTAVPWQQTNTAMEDMRAKQEQEEAVDDALDFADSF